MSQFTDLIIDLFEDFGPVSVRKMFGGYGIFYQGLMFGLVADDCLYLKADKGNIDEFISRELPPFTYIKKGKEIRMSYYMAPEEIFDDHKAAVQWAESAYGAAIRAKK